MITDQIGLHSVLLPLLVFSIIIVDIPVCCSEAEVRQRLKKYIMGSVGGVIVF